MADQVYVRPIGIECSLCLHCEKRETSRSVNLHRATTALRRPYPCQSLSPKHPNPQTEYRQDSVVPASFHLPHRYHARREKQRLTVSSCHSPLTKQCGPPHQTRM